MLMNQRSFDSLRRLSIACMLNGVVLALLVVLGASAASAQANRGTITGTVTDTSGAVVSGAAVKATNSATGVFATTISNASGIYVVPNVEPGAYSVEFTRDGFETLLRPAINVNATEEVRIDATLSIGKVSSTVTVTDSAPVLDLDTASVGTNMKGSVVTDLPLSIYGGGRFVEDFAVAITPGYSPLSSPYGAVVNGGQWFTKDYTIDGTSGTSSVRGDSMDGGPSMEAVEELQAQTSGLDAESSITGPTSCTVRPFFTDITRFSMPTPGPTTASICASPKSGHGTTASASVGPSSKTKPSSSEPSSASSQSISASTGAAPAFLPPHF
jgi:hypothetical protein